MNTESCKITSLPAAVTERLVSFGYNPTDIDSWLISFSIDKATNHIQNAINQNAIPDGLFEVAVDMACGEFFNAKYLSGQLDIAGIDLSGVVSSIKEGDTTVSFGAGSSDEEKVKALIDWMASGKECDFLCYRKMRW